MKRFVGVRFRVVVFRDEWSLCDGRGNYKL